MFEIGVHASYSCSDFSSNKESAPGLSEMNFQGQTYPSSCRNCRNNYTDLECRLHLFNPHMVHDTPCEYMGTSLIKNRLPLLDYLRGLKA